MKNDLANTEMRNLSRLAASPPYQRVYGWRKVLERVWRAGFDDGYSARSCDEQLSERLLEMESPETTRALAAAAERDRIVEHFKGMIITREWRRRFEDRHAEHLGDGLTTNGLLAAVIDEIEGMGQDAPQRTTP